MSEPSWHDKQYLPSLTLANTGLIVESWKSRAAATCSKLKLVGDISYGRHPRERMDFYPAHNAHGCVVYIHGGYWHSFSKYETAWIADGFVGQGLSVALINYPLCPEVTIGDIRKSCIDAFVHLFQNVLGSAERAAAVVTGHSAGGYLAAAHLTEKWETHGLPINPIAGVVALSGIYDVEPLRNTILNDSLRLDAEQARVLNLNREELRTRARLILAVGEAESAEFHRQATNLAESWASLSPHLIDLPAANHYTIVDDLASPAGQLNRLAVDMARR